MGAQNDRDQALTAWLRADRDAREGLPTHSSVHTHEVSYCLGEFGPTLPRPDAVTESDVNTLVGCLYGSARYHYLSVLVLLALEQTAAGDDLLEWLTPPNLNDDAGTEFWQVLASRPANEIDRWADAVAQLERRFPSDDPTAQRRRHSAWAERQGF